MSKPETGLKSIAEGRTDIYKVDPRKLNVKQGWNSRDFADPANQEHIQTLAASIAEVGVLEPLTVYWEDGKAWIEDGECRYRAAIHAIDVLKADVKTVPVKGGERYANEADRLFSQEVRNSGKAFTILEKAKLYKRLLGLGWQQGDIAKKAGITPARVSQILDYNTLPEGVKTMVLTNQVAPSTAMATVKAEGTAAEQKLKAGLAVAKAEGKTKVMQKHVETAAANNGQAATPTEPKQNIRTAIIDFFDSSDVDDSDDSIVVIKVPMENWEIIRKLLAL
jgi:ParB/RepB/Spo0J family partition protein